MRPFKNITKLMIPATVLVVMAGCTKLDQKLGSTLTRDEAADALGPQGTSLVLQGAYSDIGGPFSSQDLIFSLEENTADESLVPTRGGDWDDNGVWRVLHNHTWNADHGQILSVFNGLNKLNFDATNVLSFGPTDAQKAEAYFLRDLSLYYLLDLYGLFPVRDPGEDLRKAPAVYAGAAGVQFIIDELKANIANLPASNGSNLANPDAAKVLLMKLYLNRGAYTNRAAPTFDAADMNEVVKLGTEIINSGKYSFTPNYFDNFAPNNGTASKEAIFRYENVGGQSANNSGLQSRWNMTLHYNSYTPNNPNAGWNGFSTIGDFYKSFGVAKATTFGLEDTLLDTRIGRRVLSNLTSTQKSGIRPGFLVGQQYNENGVALKDRKGNPLAYDPNIAANMIETGPNLEVTGIRVVKYVPDYNYYGGPADNDLMIFRYADVVLMVAEAKMRLNDNAGGITLVNTLRTARGAAPVDNTFTLKNDANVEAPNTLIAERGRELYWESFRRTDLIRFGVYLKPWQYKPADDPKYLLFPIPSQSLAANPNLTQNPGY
jgi:hypothetical protein